MYSAMVGEIPFTEVGTIFVPCHTNQLILLKHLAYLPFGIIFHPIDLLLPLVEWIYSTIS